MISFGRDKKIVDMTSLVVVILSSFNCSLLSLISYFVNDEKLNKPGPIN